MRLENLPSRLRRRLFPTAHERVVNKWFANKGDATLRLNYPLRETAIVMDVGGFVGDWASAIHSKYQCKVHVFEPHPKAFAKLTARFSSQTAIKVYQFGLAAQDCKLTLSDEGPASSIFGKDHGGFEVDLKSISTWLSDNEIGSVDLLKVNIEGGEYELFEDLIHRDLMRIFHYIQIQFHPVDSGSISRWKSIRSSFSKTHRLQWDYPMVWESWEAIMPASSHTATQPVS
jgi:FkbM family methyltransferase